VVVAGEDTTGSLLPLPWGVFVRFTRVLSSWLNRAVGLIVKSTAMLSSGTGNRRKRGW